MPTQPVVTPTKALRSVSDALTLLLSGSHQHVPVLNHAQTPPPLPGLEHRPPHSAAGFAGLRQGRLLHWILFALLFGAEILDSAWVCTWVWWGFLPLCWHWLRIQTHMMYSRNGHRSFRAVNWSSLRPAQQSAMAPSEKDFPSTLKLPLASRSRVSKVPGVKHICTTRHHYQSGK